MDRLESKMKRMFNDEEQPSADRQAQHEGDQPETDPFHQGDHQSQHQDQVETTPLDAGQLEQNLIRYRKQRGVNLGE